MKIYQQSSDYNKYILFQNDERKYNKENFNWTIGGLYLTYSSNEIDFDIKLNNQLNLQRQRVWSDKEKILFLNSFFKDYNIGNLLLIQKSVNYQITHNIQYLCIDGKQRLTTIFDFIDNKYEYRGVYYDNLNIAEQRRLKTKLFPSIVVKDNDDSFTAKDYVELFLTHNVYGIQQDEKHLKQLELFLNQ